MSEKDAEQDFIATHRRTPKDRAELLGWMARGRPGSYRREAKKKGW